MEITKCKYKIRCELGACGNRADYTLAPSRTGVRSSMHICSSCLSEIAALANKTFKAQKKTEAKA